MIRSLYYTQGKLRTGLETKEWPTTLQDPDGLLWVDFEDTPPEEDEPMMREIFGFHPLAIDDALQESHVPKVDDWGEYLYVVLHSVVYEKQDGGHIRTLELDVFLGKNYLVTHHDQKIEAIERVWTSCQRDERHLKNGVDHLLYKIADEVVASHMPVIDQMDDEIDQAEDVIFSRPTPAVVENIFSLKRATITLRRIIGPQREVLNRLARDDYAVIDTKARVYFRDVYDHLVRLYDIAEGMRDLVGGVLDIYLSVINNRMNDIVKTLTVITTLFMPISFLSGFFGMNFFQPVAAPLVGWTRLIPFALTFLLMVLTPTSMLLWIRRKGWM